MNLKHIYYWKITSNEGVIEEISIDYSDNHENSLSFLSKVGSLIIRIPAFKSAFIFFIWAILLLPWFMKLYGFLRNWLILIIKNNWMQKYENFYN